MNKKIKEIAKSLGMRGWSFHLEQENRMFLSKFDPNEYKNDDEYRVYFFLNSEGIQITRRFVIKRYKYDERINLNAEDHRFIAEAEAILQEYYKTVMMKNIELAI